METNKYYTYRDLLAAIQELTDEQLDMTAVVSEGCDGNGDAEFYAIEQCCLNTEEPIAAAGHVFDSDIQPVLLFGTDPNSDGVWQTEETRRYHG
jgi:hypothetical protein